LRSALHKVERDNKRHGSRIVFAVQRGLMDFGSDGAARARRGKGMEQSAYGAARARRSEGMEQSAYGVARARRSEGMEQSAYGMARARRGGVKLTESTVRRGA